VNPRAVPPRPYAEALRDEIVQAASRQHRTRKRRRAVVKAGAAFVVVAGVVVVLVGLFVAPSEDTATADGTVQVTRVEERTLVEIVMPDRPDEVIADLRAAGLTAEQVDRTTGPSRVGQVVSVVVDGDSMPSDKPSGLSVYVDGRARITVGVGVAAADGDDYYDVSTNAFDEGEPLYCRSWPGQSTDELAKVVRSDGLAVRVIDDTAGPSAELPPGRVVLSATALSPLAVQVLTGDGAVAPAPAGCSWSLGQG
jgi:hypothetical protein